MQIHTVKRGDTLWLIAQNYGTNVEELIAANGLDDSHPLVIGQALIIPASARPTTYTVRSGESLWLIAHQYGLSLDELIQANELDNPAVLQPGQVLKIPAQIKPVIEVNAYTERFGASGVTLTKQIGEYLTYLSLFSYQVRLDGSMHAPDDSDVLTAAKEQGVAPMMVITNFENGRFSSEIAHAVLTDSDIQEKLISSIVDIMKEKGYLAINVDFEYVFPADREAYNQFLRQLTARLHPLGYLVSTALAPKLSADQKGTLYEAHDYPAHGEIVDFVILMTYEWGWSGGPPRAVAPINEVNKVLTYALSAIPPEKIMMGMPLYGYDWTLPYVQGNAWAPTISPQEAVRRAAQRGAEIKYDTLAQSPFYHYYDDNGKEHVVWYEDARSVQAKFGLVKTYGLRGVSYWVLGVPFPQNWYVLNENFTIRKLV